jgi:hypothetical protein
MVEMLPREEMILMHKARIANAKDSRASEKATPETNRDPEALPGHLQVGDHKALAPQPKA